MTQLFMICLACVFLVFSVISEHRSVPYYGYAVMAHIWLAASIIYAKVRRP